MLSLVTRPDGNLAEATVAISSGSKSFDGELLRAARACPPYVPPSDLAATGLIRVSIWFELRGPNPVEPRADTITD